MKYLKSIALMLIIFLISNIIITLLSYFDILNEKGIDFLKIIFFTLSILISGIYFGNKLKNKILIESTKYSLLIISIFLIVTIILPNLDICFKTIISYLLIIMITILGSFLGFKIKKS